MRRCGQRGRAKVVDGPDVSRETHERLRLFSDLLFRWTSVVNLVGRGDRAAIGTRHVADSLRLIPLLPACPPSCPPSCPPAYMGAAIDLGSGAGFPGLVLAIATGRHFTLVEADQRKCAFLLEAARITAAPATIVNARIEAAALPPAALVTARALAPLPRLLELAARLLTPGGTGLFPKGAGAEAEIAAARESWTFTCEVLHPPPATSGPVLRISGLAARSPRSA